MPSSDPERPGPQAASRLAPRRSTPLGRASIRELQGSGPLPAPSQRTEIPARFPGPPPHARTRAGRTTDARDKKLPALRSGGRYVVELYNTIRPHSGLGNLPPADYAKLSVSEMQRDGTLRSLGGSAPRPVALPSQTGSNDERILLIDG
jgi:hypothetical protein